MQLANLGNPDTYDARIEQYRNLVKEIYQGPVWQALKTYKAARCEVAARASPDGGLSDSELQERARILRSLVTTLVDRALWAMTEILPGAASKYLGQRCISSRVADRWRSLYATNARQVQYYKDGRKCVLRHEHVVSLGLFSAN